MAERIVMRTGEALVEGDKDYLCAEPEVVIGELDGPVGLSSSHAGAPRARARAKIANRRIGISFNEGLVLTRTVGTCATPGVPQHAREAPVRDYCLPDTASTPRTSVRGVLVLLRI